MNRFTQLVPRLAALLLLAACADAISPVAPQTTPPEIPASPDPVTLISLTCTASITSQTVRCDGPANAGVNRDVIIGGQNLYLRLTSSNIRTLADTFAFDVTVTNLIPQSLGTTNGTTADAAGVRVFFHSGPSSTTTGTVDVPAPDGRGTFTGSNQPYYQYNGVLAQNATTAIKTWKLRLTPDVTNFTFLVYVSTAVQYPVGYVDNTPYVLSLNPGEVRNLTGTVRSLVGNALPSETVSWTSSAPATAAVSGTQVTAGNSRGVANLTAASGARPALYTTAISVCQSAVVMNGASLPSSISGTDCFSSYGDPNGRPTTSYYADLYRVTLTAGQTITVTMDSGDDLDTYVLLAGPTRGELVAGNDDDDQGVLGVGSRLIYTATVSGVYVIEASTFNGLDTGNYTLHVTIN